MLQVHIYFQTPYHHSEKQISYLTPLAFILWWWRLVDILGEHCTFQGQGKNNLCQQYGGGCQPCVLLHYIHCINNINKKEFIPVIKR